MEGQEEKVLIKLILKNINKSDEFYSLSCIEKKRIGSGWLHGDEEGSRDWWSWWGMRIGYRKSNQGIELEDQSLWPEISEFKILRESREGEWSQGPLCDHWSMWFMWSIDKDHWSGGDQDLGRPECYMGFPCTHWIHQEWQQGGRIDKHYEPGITGRQ